MKEEQEKSGLWAGTVGAWQNLIRFLEAQRFGTFIVTMDRGTPKQVRRVQHPVDLTRSEEDEGKQ